MVDLLKLVLFIAIVSSIFFIKSPIVLIIVSVALIVLIGILRIDFSVLIKAFIKLLPLLLITFLFNWLLADLSEGIIILSRLLICLCMTFVFAKLTTPMSIANGIEIFFAPLRLFKVDTKYISLMISIAICMIPIFLKEIRTTLKSIEAKGQRASIKNIKIFLRPLLISLMRKTNEMEKSLISKAYK